MFSAASVCLSVCLFVNTITSERLNVRWWNLAVRCIVQKSRPSSNLGVKGQRSRSPGTKKNEKVRHFSGAVLGGASYVVRQVYAGGKTSACCLVLTCVFLIGSLGHLLVQSHTAFVSCRHMRSVVYVYFARGSGCEVLRWVCLSVGLSVCVSVCMSVREDISGTARAIFTKFCACCLCPWLGPPPACFR